MNKNDKKFNLSLRGARRGALQSLLSLILILTFALPAMGQPAVLKKSPADYASFYDRQLTPPRLTLEEIRMSKRVRQGIFARQMVKTLRLEEELPLTATEEDCIRLLKSYGITPLKGWDRFGPVTEDVYTVVIGKATGQEYLVQVKAQEVCDQIVKLLNVEWSLLYVETGRYPILEKLITDKSIFPSDEPRCPYGVAYQVGGIKPQILPHRHYIKTPLKKFLFQERDLFKERFQKGNK